MSLRSVARGISVLVGNINILPVQVPFRHVLHGFIHDINLTFKLLSPGYFKTCPQADVTLHRRMLGARRSSEFALIFQV